VNGRKISAVIVMVLSAILTLVLLGGIVGTWAVRAQANHAVTALSQGVDQGLSIALDRLSRLDGQITQAEARAQTLQETASKVGDNAEENQVLLTRIQQTVSDELAPVIERIDESVSAVADLVRSANQSVQALNALPFVHIEVPGAEQFRKLTARSDELKAAAQDLRAEVKQTSAAVMKKSVQSIIAGVRRIASVLGEAHAVVAELTSRLTNIQGIVPVAVSRVESFVNIGAWVFTLLMLLLSLGQVSLFLHGYALYTGRDPLAPRAEAKS